jgi:methyltransferase (TIGR00027 family)
MKANQHSRTAEYMAFFRATESVRPQQHRLFTDPFAISFLRPSLRRAVWLSKIAFLAKLVNWYADRRLPGARTSATARTRLIDDAIRDAARDNVTQVVILGAGFDCRSSRLCELKHVRVFEVDHPSTLEAKRLRLLYSGTDLPPNVRVVKIDFNRETLPGPLAASGFESCRQAVFVWEGVTNYLTAESVDAVLRFVAACSAGTRLIFTYIDAGVLDGSVHFEGAERVLHDVEKLGEPWTFGLHPQNAASFLSERGLLLDLDLSAAEYRARCFGASAERMKGYEFYHVVVAHVPASPDAMPSRPHSAEGKPYA